MRPFERRLDGDTMRFVAERFGTFFSSLAWIKW